MICARKIAISNDFFPKFTIHKGLSEFSANIKSPYGLQKLHQTPYDALYKKPAFSIFYRKLFVYVNFFLYLCTLFML